MDERDRIGTRGSGKAGGGAGTAGGRPMPGDRPPAGAAVGGSDAGDPAGATDWGRPSPLRGVAFGAVVALLVAAVIVVFGGILELTAGLIVLALFLGRFTAFGVAAGAGPTLAGGARLWLAIAIALGAVAVAQLGLWGIAWLQGGRLDPLSFLAETYGALVPLQALLAAGGAWWGTR